MLFRRLLKSDGVLVVSDVIPPEVPAATDAAALLRFGVRQRIFFAAALGPRPHAGVGLLAVALALRAFALSAGRDDRKAQCRRFRGAASADQYRT